MKKFAICILFLAACSASHAQEPQCKVMVLNSSITFSKFVDAYVKNAKVVPFRNDDVFQGGLYNLTHMSEKEWRKDTTIIHLSKNAENIFTVKDAVTNRFLGAYIASWEPGEDTRPNGGWRIRQYDYMDGSDYEVKKGSVVFSWVPPGSQ